MILLAEFVAARLAEHERTAHSLLYACRDPRRTPVFDFCGGPAAEAYWRLFDPGRALREIDAERRLLAELDRLVDSFEMPAYIAWDLRKIHALRYSDHPDYDPAWAPVVAK